MNFYFPVDQEQDREIRREVSRMLVARSDDNFDSYVQELPGLKDMSERELLATLRLTDHAYWENLFLIYPQLAKGLLMLWAKLSRKYPMTREDVYALT